jgi:hypothetical protein
MPKPSLLQLCDNEECGCVCYKAENSTCHVCGSQLRPVGYQEFRLLISSTSHFDRFVKKGMKQGTPPSEARPLSDFDEE